VNQVAIDGVRDRDEAREVPSAWIHTHYLSNNQMRPEGGNPEAKTGILGGDVAEGSVLQESVHDEFLRKNENLVVHSEKVNTGTKLTYAPLVYISNTPLSCI